MQSTAWAPLIVSLGLAIWAYNYLARCQGFGIPLLIIAWMSALSSGLPSNGTIDTNFFPRASAMPLRLSHLVSRPGVLATIFMQLAFLTYPPDAMGICLFTALALLFSPQSAPYKLLICVRDLLFIVFNLVLYVAITKGIYFPIGHATGWVIPIATQGYGSEYEFRVELDAANIVWRFLTSLRIAADLWFLPNYRPFTYALAATVLALGLAARAHPTAGVSSPRKTTSLILTTAAAVTMILMLAALSVAPVLLAAGAAPQYRTNTVFMMIGASAFLYCLIAIADRVAAASASRIITRSFARNAVLLPLAALIVLTMARNVAVTIKLYQNEFAYALDLLSAMASKGDYALVIFDRRDAMMPQDVPIAADADGNAIVPYDLGCFAAYCQAYGGVYAQAGRAAGIPADDLRMIRVIRGDEARKMDCGLFQRRFDRIPATVSRDTAQMLEDFRDGADGMLKYRSRYWSVSCVDYDLSWRRLSWAHANPMGDGSPAIDRSPWSIFWR
jgi:hypothetical protein